MTRFRTLSLTAALCPLFAGNALANTPLSEALRQAEVDLNLRLRYEQVDQDGPEDADALTLKTRLHYQSGAFRGFDLTLEMDDTTAVTDVDYNDGTGINTGTAVIADPEGTEINQAYLTYRAGETHLKYGRQRILLDNQRFVGGVGWRQNEQTYDGFSVRSTAADDLELFYAYVHNVNRIVGETVADGDHPHQSHLLNARYAGLSGGELVGYAYLLDNERVPGLSNDTLGLRWEGRIGPALGYNLEYARQQEAGDNPTDHTADYWLAEGIADVAAFQFKLGYEVLGSDGGRAAFSTPLATLHAFQGWTDQFLTTPADGVEDLSLSAARPLGPVKLSLVYHQLGAERSGADYGSEWGLVAATRVGPVNLSAKLADYRADTFATDTRKFWVTAEANF